MENESNNRSEWSDHALIADLERSVLFSQATTMAQNADLIRRLADRVGAQSPLAELLAAEAERVMLSVVPGERATVGERTAVGERTPR